MSWPSAYRGSVQAAAPALFLWALVLIAPGALASKPRLRLERVDASRCADEGVIDAYLVEIELEGLLRQHPSSSYRLVVDGKLVDQPPLGATTFARSGQPLNLALVIEATPSYEVHLGQIKAGLLELVRSLPEATRITVIVYGWQVRRLLARGRPRQAPQVIEAIGVGSAEVTPALDEALAIALRGLGSTPANQRRLLVSVSDGINRIPKWDVFRGLGSRARALGVTIHPVAFSPIDERGPLLNLGELAKRTGGTLRWARQPADIRQELNNLSREINGQLVQTFRLPAGCSRPHRIQVSRGTLASNPVQSPATKPVDRAGQRPTLRIILFVGVLVLVLALLTLLVLVLLRPRQGKPPRSPPR